MADEQKPGRLKSGLLLPESLWVGLILTFLGGLGGFLTLWRSSDRALLEVQQKYEAMASDVERMNGELRKLEEKHTYHAGQLGHPARS